MLKRDNILGTIAYMGGWPFTHELFTYSWGQMIQFNSEFLSGRVHYDRVTSSYHSYARNILANNMLGDWLLMLDTDIRFDPDIAFRMINTMENHNLHVLVGTYLYKRPPHMPLLYNWNIKRKTYEPILGWDKPDLFEVSAAGGGCLLIKKWVFDYIDQELHEKPFQVRRPYQDKKGKMLSEDLSFFNRLQQLDIQVFCDPRLTVDHLATTPITLSTHYNAFEDESIDKIGKKE